MASTRNCSVRRQAAPCNNGNGCAQHFEYSIAQDSEAERVGTMKFNLYSGDECVGWSELPWIDPPMGIVAGPFQPNDNYQKIQPTIREFHLYDGSLGDRNDSQLQKVMQKIRALVLQVRAETGEVLLPVEGVHLTDFSEELEDAAIEITVLGLPREQFSRFWPNAYEEYEKHFQQSV